MSAVEELRGLLDYQWGALDGSGTDLECVGLPIDNAARAIQALAEERRTANLIALAALELKLGSMRERGLLATIAERLDLMEVKS